MNIKILILFLVVLFSHKSIAGDKKGNGAGFVVCPTQTTLLDFYEGKLESFNWNGNEIDLAIYLINKFQDLNPVRSENYIQLITNFYKETKFEADSELGYIPDAGTIRVEIPRECRLVQGVLQKLIVFGQEKRYLISKNQWDKLDTINKAGVILHEVIYRELQSPNSYYIRHYVNWLFSTALVPVNDKVFYQELKNADFKWVYLDGFPMDVEKLIIGSGPIRSRFSYPNLPFLILNQSVISKAHIVDSYPNGSPKVIHYKGSISYETPKYSLKICANTMLDNCRINLAQNGMINVFNNVDITDKQTGTLLENKSISLDENGKDVQIF